jgi:hypothetical protein
MDKTRRRLLAALGTTSVAALAGCTGDNEGGNKADDLPVQQQAKLIPDDGDDRDFFGQSVAMSGDGSTVLIGAQSEEGPYGRNAGSAYVFSRASEDWQQQAKLIPDDGDSDDQFGNSIAVSNDGSTAIIGAKGDSDLSLDAGSTYVFSRTGEGWQQQAKLLPEDGNRRDLFGETVAVSGDGSTTIIGASPDDNTNGDLAGSAYVFSQAGGGWQQQAKLLPEDGDEGDGFGHSVAMSSDGNTAIIGAYDDEDPNGDRAGSAYVFSGAGGTWQQRAKLAPDDGDVGDYFGSLVAVSDNGSTVIIGAPGDEDPNSERVGWVYVFSRASGGWQQRAKLATDDGDDRNVFSNSVVMSGDGGTVIIGVRLGKDPNGEEVGSAYVFSKTGGVWQQQTKLGPDDGDDGDLFGDSVAVADDGSTAIIGAPENSNPNGDLAGSAYVFE